MNITLIGMPGSGKSTIGVLLAKRLGMEFVDTDLLIQKREKRRLPEIIAREGMDRFLEIENEVNASLEVENTIIAPGGSAVYGREAMEHFRKISTVVYLKLSLREHCLQHFADQFGQHFPRGPRSGSGRGRHGEPRPVFR